MRRSRRLTVFAIVALIGLLLAGWMSTAHWGIAAATDYWLSIVEDGLNERARESRLRVDPQIEPPTKLAWYFVGNGRTPLPFIVSLDLEMSGDIAAPRETYYFVWIFGWTARILEAAKLAGVLVGAAAVWGIVRSINRRTK